MTRLQHRFAPPGTELRLLALVVVVESLLVGAYFLGSPAEVRRLRYVLYPFIWINVGLWAVLNTDLPAATTTQRRLAGLAAGAYFLLLAFVTGLVGVSVDLPLLAVGAGTTLGLELLPLHAASHPVGWSVSVSAPGWSPRIAYVGHEFYAYFVPYRVIGYLSLAYLVYAAALDAARSTLPGVLGMAACLGCSFPVVTALVGAAGGSAGLAAAVTDSSVDLSTLAFVAAVGLLYWRPGTDRIP
jgi:hypothetical protein